MLNVTQQSRVTSYFVGYLLPLSQMGVYLKLFNSRLEQKNIDFDNQKSMEDDQCLMGTMVSSYQFFKFPY